MVQPLKVLVATFVFQHYYDAEGGVEVEVQPLRVLVSNFVSSAVEGGFFLPASMSRGAPWARGCG